MTTKKQNNEGDKKSQTPAKMSREIQTPGERFTEAVVREFTGHSGSPDLTSYQRRLIQNYFISIDLAIKNAEEKRMRKKEQFRDPLEISWQNLNMQNLAVNVVACARIGYDPALPNHINMMPFKNNTLNKYDIVFIEGYRGKELKAIKYGFEPPNDVIVEVVYENDTFRPIKKDKNNDKETYIFEIGLNPFDRGDIIGGFWYHSYSENPSKNKLMFYSIHDIEKRKPSYASAEFWGGTKDKWENGKKTGTEKVEGWYHEMVWKTIYRAAYNAITIDGKKIDDDLMQMLEQEARYDIEVNPEQSAIRDSADKNRILEEKANKKQLVMDDAENIEEEMPEEKSDENKSKHAEEKAYQEAMEEINFNENSNQEPGF